MGLFDRSTFKHHEKRTLDDTDLDAFWAATEQRKSPLSRDQIIAHMERKNSFRWWRLKHDYKWLQKQMRKLGLNPDEARELL